MRWTCAVQFRKQVVVNTDPQRRCYDGVNFSEVVVWTDWADVCPFRNEADARESAACYKQINPGREYRVVPIGESSYTRRAP
jgi:hypothetical protein